MFNGIIMTMMTDYHHHKLLLLYYYYLSIPRPTTKLQKKKQNGTLTGSDVICVPSKLHLCHV